GKHDCNTATDEERMMLRLLNPIVKLYTAKQAMSVISEGLESFGGLGYIEETGLPSGLRDAQVLPIWEGTTNVLSMDVLRVLMKTSGEALKLFETIVVKKLQTALLNERTRDVSERIINSTKELIETVRQNPMVLEVAARDFSYSLARSYIGKLTLIRGRNFNLNESN
ncbi:putative acyl-CoA dehydrogenase AidB-like protein, partial [Leptotrombidium deliense]